MKTKQIIMLLLASALFFSCKKKNNTVVPETDKEILEIERSEIEIVACNTRNPAWLITKVKNILAKTPNFRPVKVSSYKESNKEIIYLSDYVNSMWSENVMFFECSGKQIKFDSDEYKRYSNLLNQRKFKLLWSNFIKTK